MHTVGKCGDKAVKQMVGSQVWRQGGGRCGREEQGVAHPGLEDIQMESEISLENIRIEQKIVRRIFRRRQNIFGGYFGKISLEDT